MYCIANSAFKACRLFLKDSGPTLHGIPGRTLKENEENTWRRKTLVPAGGKGESQLSVLSEVAKIRL